MHAPPEQHIVQFENDHACIYTHLLFNTIHYSSLMPTASSYIVVYVRLIQPPYTARRVHSAIA